MHAGTTLTVGIELDEPALLMLEPPLPLMPFDDIAPEPELPEPLPPPPTCEVPLPPLPPVLLEEPLVPVLIEEELPADPLGPPPAAV
jgi:hypothetical protein